MKKRWIICVVIILLAAAGYLASSRYVNRNSGNQAPVITMDKDTVKISVEDTDEAILEGISAMDPEDGDVTDSLVLESLSNFTKKHVRKAVIACFDSSGNVTRVERKVKYKDYESPRFTLTGPLSVSTLEVSTVTSRIQASDVLDGDISGEVQLIADTDAVNGAAGVYEATLRVANSVGDTEELPVTLTIFDTDSRSEAEAVTLTDYLIYLKKGDHFQPGKYVDQVTDSLGREWKWHNDSKTFTRVSKGNEKENEEDTLKESDVKIENPVDTSEPGVYEVRYCLKADRKNDMAGVRLIVVVEE